MFKEVIYFCAELLNYWSMTFWGLKLFAKVYDIHVNENKIVENVLFALMCLPIGILGAVNYIVIKYSIFLTYVLIMYMYILVRFINKRKFKVSMFSVALYIFTIRLIDLWIVTVINEVNKMSRFASIVLIEQGLERIVFMFILSCIYFFIYYFCCRNNFIKDLMKNNYYCGLICLYAFFGNSCFNGVYWFENRDNIIRYWIFYLICAFVLVGGYAFYSIEIKGKEREKLLNMRNDMLEANYRGLQKSYEENRTLQHDYKNHLLAVSELIKDYKNEEALDYIHMYIDYNKISLNDIKSGNDIVDIIVNSKSDEAREKNIKFISLIDCLEDLLIEDIDMCALLANLLDNAIEACEKLKDGNTYIKLKIHKRNSMLMIQLINSIDSKMLMKKYFFDTEKEDLQLHGWGMKSIDRVIEKYNGTKEYYLENNHIEFFITLSI